MNRIHIASGDAPLDTVKRVVGRENAGVYCANKECEEFFALAVTAKNAKQLAGTVEFVADGPVCFECPYCKTVQKRQASEIAHLVLTEGRLKKPKRPKSAH